MFENGNHPQYSFGDSCMHLNKNIYISYTSVPIREQGAIVRVAHVQVAKRPSLESVVEAAGGDALLLIEGRLGAGTIRAAQVP